MVRIIRPLTSAVMIGLVAFLLSLPSLPQFSTAEASQHSQGPSTVVVVPSTAQWVNTNIRVNIGDKIVVTATGAWTPGGPEPGMVGPDGSSVLWPDNFLNLTDIGVCSVCATTLTPHWAALIGYIGAAPPPPGSYTFASILTEAEKTFLVGSNYSATANLSGTLWFNFNDDAYSNFTIDNAGQVTASVSVTRAQGPTPDVSLVAPFNNGVAWTVTSGYYNNRDQSLAGCHIGIGPDHCRNQLFGLDMVPDQQSDTAILAPIGGTVAFIGTLEGGCIGLRIILDNGLNMNVCHFATLNVSRGERVPQGKVLGNRSTPHVHLSLDNRYRIGTLCPRGRCVLPVPFNGQHTFEGMSLDPDPNGETVPLPYSLCGVRGVNCQFKVAFGQYQGLSGTSSNSATP